MSIRKVQRGIILLKLLREKNKTSGAQLDAEVYHVCEFGRKPFTDVGGTAHTRNGTYGRTYVRDGTLRWGHKNFVLLKILNSILTGVF